MFDVLNLIINLSMWTFQGTFSHNYMGLFTQLNSLCSLRFVNRLTLNSFCVFDLNLLSCFRRMETERFELLTPCLQGRCSPNWATPPSGWNIRFHSHWRTKSSREMGLSGLEPPTSRLSGVRSNRLSYKPIFNLAATYFPMPSPA